MALFEMFKNLKMSHFEENLVVYLFIVFCFNFSQTNWGSICVQYVCCSCCVYWSQLFSEGKRKTARSRTHEPIRLQECLGFH